MFIGYLFDIKNKYTSAMSSGHQVKLTVLNCQVIYSTGGKVIAQGKPLFPLFSVT